MIIVVEIFKSYRVSFVEISRFLFKELATFAIINLPIVMANKKKLNH